MGLSKSKPSDRRGEEQKKGSPYSSAKSKDKLLEKRFQESRQASEETGKPLDSLLLATATAPHREPFASLEEKANVKQKPSKKKAVIPQIVITRASTESLTSYSSLRSEEQRTIQEQADWGPYSRHRSPSTAAAFSPHAKE
ncbi:spermatogenesis-associated protein 33 isoform X1 [Fukomys damarensis]|uniref:Spermatogenesis-associated protein 33 n=1 Tax=Fukomys damarensis TaxID=885580 RepID=A0A091DIB7_FUKDA|nr:spermatogenesis-associated protein 33 isoform X1 [Fukomys damarensis]KFO31874.1 hypothetical protein H920_06765 [Fukomys damarensis]